MDNTAIKQIQESSSIPELISQLKNVETKTPTIITPGDFKISNLEQYMDIRSSFRLNYSTISIHAFTEYVKGSAISKLDGKCFVDSENMRAKAVFDIGTYDAPLHQLHTATLQIKRTSAYRALVEACNGFVDQREAAEFFEDWEEFIHGVSGESGGYLSNKEAVVGLRNMTIDTIKQSRSNVGDFSHEMSDLEKIEANKDQNLPSEFTFECEPFLDFPLTKFKVRLSVITGGSEPRVSFRIIRHEAMKELFAVELLEKIEKQVGDKVPCLIGTI